MRLITLAAVAAASSTLAHAGSVELRISNVGPTGPVYAQLCTEAEFMRSTCAFHAKVAPHAGETVVSFPNVAPGRYAASAYQDVDSNGKLNFGMMGAPSEPWGTSRDAKAVMGPPLFNDAAVVVTATPTTIPIAMQK